MSDPIQTIFEAFETRGSESYGIEAVTQLEHALQCATFALQNSASDQIVVASLLHDIGHILGESPLPGDLSENYDDKHEDSGYEFLVEHFGPDVAEPVRMHVAAKRYLCTVQSDYLSKLSPTSVKSFQDQGGQMSELEVAAFEKSKHFSQSVILRKWDDLAKDVTPATRDLDDFREYLERTVLTPSKEI